MCMLKTNYEVFHNKTANFWFCYKESWLCLDLSGPFTRTLIYSQVYGLKSTINFIKNLVILIQI
jgi:hypothetical protein